MSRHSYGSSFVEHDIQPLTACRSSSNDHELLGDRQNTSHYWLAGAFCPLEFAPDLSTWIKCNCLRTSDWDVKLGKMEAGRALRGKYERSRDFHWKKRRISLLLR